MCSDTYYMFIISFYDITLVYTYVILSPRFTTVPAELVTQAPAAGRPRSPRRSAARAAGATAAVHAASRSSAPGGGAQGRQGPQGPQGPRGGLDLGDLDPWSYG